MGARQFAPEKVRCIQHRNIEGREFPLCVCARAPCSPYFAHMASFVRIALAGAGSFAEVNIVEGRTRKATEGKKKRRKYETSPGQNFCNADGEMQCQS